MIRDDELLRDALELAFADEPPVRTTWADVRREEVRRSPRRRLRVRVLALVALAVLAVPAVLLADQAWHLAVGSPAPPQLRSLLGASIAFPTSGGQGREDAARAVVVAQAGTSRGKVYLVEAPTLPRTIPSNRGPVTLRCLSLITSFRLASRGQRAVRVDGTTYWGGTNRICGGVPPAGSNPHLPLPYGSMRVDARLAVAFGGVRPGETMTATRIDGTAVRVPVWHGSYLAVVRDDGRPSHRLASMTLRNARGQIVRVERTFAN